VIFTAQDVIRNFDPRDTNRGRIYQTQGQVKDVQIEKNGAKISALVQGTARTPYHVTVTAEKRHGIIEIESECTCPVGYMCKHGVAALYEAIAQESRAHERIHAAGHAPKKSDGTLSPKLLKWIDQFDEEDSDDAVNLDDRIVYHILIDSDIHVGVKIIPALQHKLRDGNWSRKRPLTSGQLFSLRQSPRILTQEDRAMLGAIDTSKFFGGAVAWELPPDAPTISFYLQRIVRTGRAFFDDECSLALKHGKELKGTLSWTLLPDGRQKPTIAAEKSGLTVIPMLTPWYLDPHSGETGPLHCEEEPKHIAQFLNAPPVSETEATLLRKRLKNCKRQVPTPFKIVQSKEKALYPVPTITVSQTLVTQHDSSETIIDARLMFDYDGQRVNPSDPSAHYVQTNDEQFILHKRNEKAEEQILKKLGQHSLTLRLGDHSQTAHINGTRIAPASANSPWFWMDFLHQASTDLRTAGFKIIADEDFGTTIIEPDSEEIEAAFTQKGDWWFSMDLGIMVGGARVPLLPVLVSMLKKIKSASDIDYLKSADKCYAPLPDGRLVALPADRIYTILKTLVELFDDKPLDDEGNLRVSMDLTAAFLKLEAITNKRWIGEGQLRKLVEKLNDFEGIKKHAAPKGLKATLRPYQIEGYNWLHFLGQYGLSGILADDMGLGKTIQTLAYLLAQKEKGKLDCPALIVMPTSLIANWQSEATKFTPQLNILTLHGKERLKQFKSISKFDLVLTTYPLLPRDKDELSKHDWSIVILDEAQAIKNPSAKMTQAACELQAKQRLCLTGTPVENHLGEAWSIFTFLMPGLLGDHKDFNKHYRNPIERDTDSDRKDLLARRLRPFVLRRLKSEVAKELPPKTEIIRRVTLAEDQRDLYETVRHVMNDRVRDEIAAKGLARSHIVILDALLKLRQTCCDPRLVKLEAARKVASSAKLEELMEMLPTLIEEGRKVLLFSQFTSMLDLIKPALKEAEIDYVELRGSTKDRVTPITRFQNGEVPLFLISLKAGGTGLNLTAADTVIHYDPWWNPSVENQATDRAHRIGQNKPVFVYKLIAEGTVEERILELQERKSNLANALFGDAPGAAANLSPDDIKWLMGEQ